jgi:hypothetical protein
MAYIPPWSDLGYFRHASNAIPHSAAPSPRLRHIRDQSSHSTFRPATTSRTPLTSIDPGVRPLHPPTPLLDLGIQAPKSTLPRRSRLPDLGPPRSHLPRAPPGLRIPLVPLGYLHHARKPSLRSRHPRSHHVAQRRHSANAHRRVCAIQHVRASE